MAFQWPIIPFEKHSYAQKWDQEFNARWSNALATFGESEYLEQTDKYGKSQMNVCPADCVCHQTNLVNLVCMAASPRGSPTRNTPSPNVCTEATKSATVCPHCNISASCTTCIAYATLIADMDSYVSMNYDNDKMAVQRRLEELFEKYKGTKNNQSWLGVKNQSNFRNSLDNLCAYIQKLDLIGGYDDMKETACVYVCETLSSLHPHYEVVFDFWTRTLTTLLDLHQDHLLEVCVKYWRTQWEQDTSTILRQAILKGVRMLITKFPKQMHTRFFELNIYVYAVSSILHTLPQDVKLQS